MNRFQSVLMASTRWFSSARLVGQTTGHPLHRVPYEASARSATQSEAKSTLLTSTYPGATILASVTLGALAEGCASPTEPGAVLTLRLELAEGVQKTTIEASLGELNERTIPVTLVDGHISEQCAVYVPPVVSQLTVRKPQPSRSRTWARCCYGPGGGRADTVRRRRIRKWPQSSRLPRWRSRWS